jgi:hypothetical protein
MMTRKLMMGYPGSVYDNSNREIMNSKTGKKHGIVLA